MAGTTTAHRNRLIIAVLVASAAVIAVAAGLTSGFDSAGRQEQVAERGVAVMPFDLDATTHTFEPTPDGGVQTVVADDPADHQQIDLVQQHLSEEAAAFTRGEFDDPAQIHGADMPGLRALEAGADRIDIGYDTRADGAVIRFTTDHPELVAALHDWFAAQTSDHGAHAG